MCCVGVPSSLGFSSSFWVLVPTFLCPYQFQPCSFCEEPSGQEGGSGPHPGGSSTSGPSLTGLQAWPRSQVHAKLGIRPGGSPAAGTRGMMEDTKPARAYPGAPAVWGQLYRAWPRGMSSALAPGPLGTSSLGQEEALWGRWGSGSIFLQPPPHTSPLVSPACLNDSQPSHPSRI